MIKHIVVFDFDSTLVDSPVPTPEAKAKWSSVHGMEWKYKGGGWWSKPESLCTKAFDIKCVPHVKDAAIDAINDPNTYAVVVTGRMGLFSKIVKEILRENGLPYFNGYFFNNSHNTLTFKLNKFEEFRNEFPEATHFTIWEDRVEHIPHFIEWGEKHYGDNFTLHEVRI